MQLFFSPFVTDSLSLGGGQYSLAALLKEKHWIWPLMVFYKLNLALEMY
jgi:hypothetical protein